MRLKLLFLLLSFFALAEEKLSILTYNSMVGKDSLGEVLQKECGPIQFTTAPNSTLIASKAKLIKEKLPIDLLLGLEESLLLDPELSQLLETQIFFDQSPMGFLSSEVNLPDKLSLEDLQKHTELSAIQDPRGSSPGLTFLWFVFQKLGEDQAKEFLSSHKLFKNIFPDWSQSYKFFSEGKIKLIWTYKTSYEYHLKKGEGNKYKFIPLSLGLPLQREAAAIVKWSKNKTKAQLFLKCLQSPNIQKATLEKNFMYPITQKVEGDTIEKVKFEKLHEYKEIWKKTQF